MEQMQKGEPKERAWRSKPNGMGDLFFRDKQDKIRE